VESIRPRGAIVVRKDHFQDSCLYDWSVLVMIEIMSFTTKHEEQQKENINKGGTFHVKREIQALAFSLLLLGQCLRVIVLLFLLFLRMFFFFFLMF